MFQSKLSRQDFREAILAKNKKYHIHHSFNKAMNNGKLCKKDIQLWVANRFYYQETIPRKDAAIIMNCPVKELRQEWIKRIIDHDEGGGIEAWLQLGQSVGLSNDVLLSHSMLLPGVKFAVDGYFNFCKNSNYKDSMTSSLTELFAPQIHMSRLESWPYHYPWIDIEGYSYFRKRLSEARRDVNFTLDFVLDNYKTSEEQDHALSIIDMKLNVLWCMLDCIEKYSEYNNNKQ
jgi:pyrroloquinoline-quinone synthase